MKKTENLSNQKLMLSLPILVIAFALSIFLTLANSGSAVAHGGRLHLPLALPSCTARVLVCEVPSSSVPQIQTGAQAEAQSRSLLAQDEHHCVDGAGVPRSCALDGPFQYMPQNLAYGKGGVNAAQNLEAMSETPCVNGAAGIYPCSNVDLLSFLPINDMGGGSANDIWGWTDPTTGGEFVIMGRRDGTSFVDISDPVNPVYLGNLPSEDGVASIWRDVKVYNNHAFIVMDDFPGTPRTHGMQIFDLTQLSAPGTVSPQLPITFSATTVYDELYGAHNIAINEETGFAYAVGVRHSADTAMECDGGLHMINVNDPANPAFAGCAGEDGYTHDTQCVIYDGPDVDYQGKEICFSSNEDTFTIVDVEDKSNPETISKAHYLTFCTGNDDTDCNRDGFTLKFYVHQGWLTEDHAYFIQNDEYDERGLGNKTRTYMWNVEDLDNPQYMGDHTFESSGDDHNLYIRDSYVFEANYRSGLRILDASKIAQAKLFEIAYFDTYPADNELSTSGNSGAWSSYPFFESGAVAISDIDDGLFVVRPSLERATLSIYFPIVQQD